MGGKKSQQSRNKPEAPEPRSFRLLELTIGGAALAVALWTAWATSCFNREILRETQTFNRETFRPYIGIVVKTDRLDATAGFVFTNAGVGTAIPEYMRVTVDDVEVQTFSELGMELGRFRRDFIRDFHGFHYGEHIRPGDTREAIWNLVGAVDSCMGEASSRVTMSLCYCSIYAKDDATECWTSYYPPERAQKGPCPKPGSTVFDPGRFPETPIRKDARLPTCVREVLTQEGHPPK